MDNKLKKSMKIEYWIQIFIIMHYLEYVTKGHIAMHAILF